MAEKKEGKLARGGGKVNIAEEVIASIAGIAASEVEGLGRMKGSVAEQVVGIFGGRQKGVETELKDDSVAISLKVAIQYGHPIHQIAQKIQTKVKNDVEEMTGLKVSSVDVYVQKLQLPEERGRGEEVAE